MRLAVEGMALLYRVVDPPDDVMAGKVCSGAHAPSSPSMLRSVPFGHVVTVGFCHSAEQLDVVEAICRCGEGFFL